MPPTNPKNPRSLPISEGIETISIFKMFWRVVYPRSLPISEGIETNVYFIQRPGENYPRSLPISEGIETNLRGTEKNKLGLLSEEPAHQRGY